MNAQERERWIHHAALEISGLQADQGRPGVPEFTIEAIEQIIADQFGASSLPQATPGGLQLFKSLADKVEDGEVSIDSLCDDKTARGWMGNRGQFDAGDNDEEALPQATPQDAPEHLPENRYKSTVGRD